MAAADRSVSSAGLDLQERVVEINRVAKVVKGGRRFSFTALVVVGDENDIVGVGYGKANEVPLAIPKGVERAKKNLFTRARGTVDDHAPDDGHLRRRPRLLKPASPGTGVIAGGGVRAVLELAGIHDILSKSLGTPNPINMVRATEAGLRTCAAPRTSRGCAACPSTRARSQSEGRAATATARRPRSPSARRARPRSRPRPRSRLPPRRRPPRRPSPSPRPRPTRARRARRRRPDGVAASSHRSSRPTAATRQKHDTLRRSGCEASASRSSTGLPAVARDGPWRPSPGDRRGEVVMARGKPPRVDAESSACTTSSRPPAPARPRKRVGRGEGSGHWQDLRPRPQGLRLARGRKDPRGSRAARTRSTCGCASCAVRTRRCRCRSSRSGRTRSP